MITPKVDELRRTSAHQAQVALVRASLLRGVSYSNEQVRTVRPAR